MLLSKVRNYEIDGKQAAEGTSKDGKKGIRAGVFKCLSAQHPKLSV